MPSSYLSLSGTRMMTWHWGNSYNKPRLLVLRRLEDLTSPCLL